MVASWWELLLGRYDIDKIPVGSLKKNAKCSCNRQNLKFIFEFALTRSYIQSISRNLWNQLTSRNSSAKNPKIWGRIFGFGNPILECYSHMGSFRKYVCSVMGLLKNKQKWTGGRISAHANVCSKTWIINEKFYPSLNQKGCVGNFASACRVKILDSFEFTAAKLSNYLFIQCLFTLMFIF